MRPVLTACGIVLSLLALAAAPGAYASEGRHDTVVNGQSADVQAAALYGTVADAIPASDAAALLLRMTNAARTAAGAERLEWSDMAARLAQQQADAMTAGRFGGHYDAAGRKPAQRWNRLGQTDNVEENIVYYEVNRPVALTPELVNHMVTDWLASASHRANLLDPLHTSSGCAFSIVQNGGVSYIAGVQEFVRHYGSCRQLPATASAGETLAFSGLLNADQVKLAFIGLGHEALPQPLTPQDAADFGWTYSLPPALRSLRPAQVGYDFHAGSFTTPLKLPPSWNDCAVYVTVWVRRLHDPASAKPFCVLTQVVEIK